MMLIFITTMIIGIYEGFREMRMVRSGLLNGVEPSKNLLRYILNE